MTVVIRKARFIPFRCSAPTVIILATSACLLAGCTVPTAEGVDGATGESFQVRGPSGPALVLDSTDPAELALTASQAFFYASPVAVLASADDADARSTAAATGSAIAAPVLLVDGGVSDANLVDEIERLGVGAVVVIGDEQAVAEVGEATGEADVVRFDPGALNEAARAAATSGSGSSSQNMQKRDSKTELPSADYLDKNSVESLRTKIPDVVDPLLLREVMVAVDPQPGQEAAIGTALAAGAVPVKIPGGNLTGYPKTVETIRTLRPLGVVGVGGEFGSASDLDWQVAAAMSGKTLPDGSLRLFPGRYVATSYTPTASADPAVDAAYAVDTAAIHGQEWGGDPVVRVTTSVRSSLPGEDGDYVMEQPLELIAPAVDTIRAADQLVLLDVVPGNQPLVEQLEDLEPLLSRSGVGVSVHPEFRMANGDVDAGSVPVSELQAVVDQLARNAMKQGLPQTMLEVHQSTAASVMDRESLDVPPQVAVVFTAAGPSEGQPTSGGVWADVTGDLPAHTFAGWSAPGRVPADPVRVIPDESVLGVVSVS